MVVPVDDEWFNDDDDGGSRFILPTTNVTLSVIDFSVATASSCVTFSKLRSP